MRGLWQLYSIEESGYYIIEQYHYFNQTFGVCTNIIEMHITYYNSIMYTSHYSNVITIVISRKLPSHNNFKGYTIQ